MNKEKSKREYLSRDDIAHRANEMLTAIFGRGYDRFRPQPVEQILEIYRNEGWIQFSHSESLGDLPGGLKILGEFSVEPFRIRIDKDLIAQSPRFKFTLAHEIGHFCLHRRLIGSGKYISREQLPRDSAEQLRYREMAFLSDLGWVEWQANEFAMALLLPTFALMKDIVRIQQEIGILRNQGILYFDDQPRNLMDCTHITATLALKYQIPRGMIWKRLRYLGILQDRRRNRSRQDHEELDPLFHSIESNRATSAP